MLSGEDADRRFVVVAETRRVWTRAEKEAIVAESNVEGVVASQVARRHHLNPNLLYRWRHEFAAEAAGKSRGDRKAPRGRKQAEPDEASNRLALPAPEKTCEPEVSSGPVWIEVELRNGRRLRCPPDIEPRRLAQLARACEGS